MFRFWGILYFHSSDVGKVDLSQHESNWPIQIVDHSSFFICSNEPLVFHWCAPHFILLSEVLHVDEKGKLGRKKRHASSTTFR